MVDPNGASVLWDVVEEHLAEAEFLFEQFERALESAVLTVADLARGVEPRLLAHVDGLKVGGQAVFEALLAKVLAAPEPSRPAALAVASWVAIEAGDFERLRPAFDSSDGPTRRALSRACELVGNASLDRWLLQEWNAAERAPRRSSLLSALAARRLSPAPLISSLQSDDLPLVRAALGAARYADARRHLPVIEYLLDHDDDAVRRAALLPAILLGSPQALLATERFALDPAQPRRDAMVLYATFGGPSQHQKLVGLLERPSHRREALFALGFSANLGVLGALSRFLDGAEDPLVPKFAAQAVATLTGIDLRDDAFALAALSTDDDAARTLPPLEGEDLDADLVPPPEEMLPVPNGDAIRKAAAEVARRFPRDRAVLGGVELSSAAVQTFLSRAPLGQRHAAAMFDERLGAARAGSTRGLTRRGP